MIKAVIIIILRIMIIIIFSEKISQILKTDKA
ncbi:hypothetical protein qdsa002_91 [Staphylococcus phage qdsa002]|uniref:Uncharacterized protein n=1 Tax=Staphylococcus phage qdsa002 TaxID=1970746 RepID=A0A1X9SJ05_9CAUD|nr:hypothetical protein qdsa002_91 [Staphylococcus phage qdsa002]